MKRATLLSRSCRPSPSIGPPSAGSRDVAVSQLPAEGGPIEGLGAVLVLGQGGQPAHVPERNDPQQGSRGEYREKSAVRRQGLEQVKDGAAGSAAEQPGDP